MGNDFCWPVNESGTISHVLGNDTLRSDRMIEEEKFLAGVLVALAIVGCHWMAVDHKPAIGSDVKMQRTQRDGFRYSQRADYTCHYHSVAPY